VPPADPTLLQKRRGGQFAYNDWLEQRNNEATIRSVGRVLTPTQDLMPFQRKVRTVVLESTVLVGQKVVWSRVVPQAEMWRLAFVSVFNGDSGNQDVRLNIAFAFQNSIIYLISKRLALAGTNTPLYPSIPRSGTSPPGFFDQRGGPAPEMVEGDNVQIIVDTNAVEASSTWRLTLRYEIIPAANEHSLDEEWSNVVS